MKTNHCWWFTPPPGLELFSDEVHVWYASLVTSTSVVQQHIRLLSPDERLRAQLLRSVQDRQRFILGRGILRRMLGLYLGIEPRRLKICYGHAGKPRLAETSYGQVIQFNLSHTQNLALYAFTRNRDIGIDVEYIKPFPEIEKIAKQYFSAREYADFHTLSALRKVEAFYNCWTRKEAFLKAKAVGLAYPLNKFEVSLIPGEPSALFSIDGDVQKALAWSLQDLKFSSNYSAALAVRGHAWRLRCLRWPA